MVEMWRMYPDAGLCEMIGLLFHEHGMAVSRSVMWDYSITYEPQLLRQCKVNCLQCCCFWVAGVNDIWAIDQHDKWLCFGLALHTGIEPYSGWILWMKVWHSNHNPQLILSYYLDTVKEFGLIPMIMQSDPGMENFAIANAQNLLHQMLVHLQDFIPQSAHMHSRLVVNQSQPLRQLGTTGPMQSWSGCTKFAKKTGPDWTLKCYQMHNPTLEGYVQHQWMHTKKNIKPKIAWSQLCHCFSPGFESLLNTGVDAGWYDPNNMLQLMLFHWVFIPWLQVKLNAYQDHINNSQKCHDKRKVLPHRIPELIYTCAEDYEALDFKVMVFPTAIEQVHVIFDLVPPSLNVFIEECYVQLGHPSVGCTSTWNVYCDILNLMQCCTDVPAILMMMEGHVIEDIKEVNLLPGLQDLHETEGYMGSIAMEVLNCDEPDIPNEINTAPTLLVAHFSSEDEDEEADEEDVDSCL
ncbi:hypothetical protein EDC04DRAFT_2617703 [Pisolithus marmoratus]|nr:hypothetical protein EDC04DRAFT_2617703 [Pisolithus marmoratus]